jgi:hypothetical protein
MTTLRKAVSSSVLATLAAASLVACGAAADGGPDQGPSNDTTAGTGVPSASGPAGSVAGVRTTDAEVPGGTVVATAILSPTHTVTFYELADGRGLYVDLFNVDLDGATALDHDKLRNEPLSDLYLELAGTQANAEAFTRLQAIDAASEAAKAATTVPAEPSVPGVASEATFTHDLAAKSFDSDASWFSSKFCNGCIGAEGTREPGSPSSYPTCTTNPEVCLVAASPITYERSTIGFSWAAYNMASSGTGTFKVTYADPCQHDSWWSRHFSVCTKGALVGSWPIQPRQAIFSSMSSGTTFWTIDVAVTGPGNVALELDY